MKPRQFKQMANLNSKRRRELLVQGLQELGAHVAHIVHEISVCNDAGAYRAARLLRNVGYEESGKFLVLIDSCRSPESDKATLTRQFDRAADHLAKLIYAQ